MYTLLWFDRWVEERKDGRVEKQKHKFYIKDLVLLPLTRDLVLLFIFYL